MCRTLAEYRGTLNYNEARRTLIKTAWAEQLSFFSNFVGWFQELVHFTTEISSGKLFTCLYREGAYLSVTYNCLNLSYAANNDSLLSCYCVLLPKVRCVTAPPPPVPMMQTAQEITFLWVSHTYVLTRVWETLEAQFLVLDRGDIVDSGIV
jgi:hypothetical protein